MAVSNYQRVHQPTIINRQKKNAKWIYPLVRSHMACWKITSMMFDDFPIQCPSVQLLQSMAWWILAAEGEAGYGQKLEKRKECGMILDSWIVGTMVLDALDDF